MSSRCSLSSPLTNRDALAEAKVTLYHFRITTALNFAVCSTVRTNSGRCRAEGLRNKIELAIIYGTHVRVVWARSRQLITKENIRDITKHKQN